MGKQKLNNNKHKQQLLLNLKYMELKMKGDQKDKHQLIKIRKIKLIMLKQKKKEKINKQKLSQ